MVSASTAHLRRLAATLIAWLALLSFAPDAFAREISAVISAETIDVNERLTFIVNAEGDARAIVPPHAPDFNIVGSSTQTSMSFVNGHMSRVLTATYQLAPTRTGELIVGPAQVVLNTGGTVDTERFTVRVTGTPRRATQPPPAPTHRPSAQMPSIPPPARPLRTPGRQSFGDYPALGAPANDGFHTQSEYRFDPNKPFILPFVSKKEVVVGEPFLVEYIYFAPVRGASYTGTDLGEPAFVGAWFKDISDSRMAGRARLSTTYIAGNAYRSQIVRSYLVVPLEEGPFDIAPVSLTIQADTFVRRAVAEQTLSPRMNVEVLPLPEAGRPSPNARNVGRYHFDVTLTPVEAQVGDTFQLTLEVFGIGVPSQIRLPNVELPKGLRAFAPVQNTTTEESSLGWVESRLQHTVSFQASEEGDYVIPPIQFHWYDPWDGLWKSDESEPFTLRVQGVNPSVAFEVDDTPPSKPLRVSWLDGLPTGAETSAEIGFAAQLRRHDEPWRGSPLYFALLGVPIVATLSIVGMNFFRRRRAASAPTRAFARAGRGTIRALRAQRYEGPASLSELERLVRAYLRARHIPNAVGATLPDLERSLGETRDKARAAELIATLDTLQNARYGGSSKEVFVVIQRDLIEWVERDHAELSA